MQKRRRGASCISVPIFESGFHPSSKQFTPDEEQTEDTRVLPTPNRTAPAKPGVPTHSEIRRFSSPRTELFQSGMRLRFQTIIQIPNDAESRKPVEFVKFIELAYLIVILCACRPDWRPKPASPDHYRASNECPTRPHCEVRRKSSPMMG